MRVVLRLCLRVGVCACVFVCLRVRDWSFRCSSSANLLHVPSVTFGSSIGPFSPCFLSILQVKRVEMQRERIRLAEEKLRRTEAEDRERAKREDAAEQAGA